MHVIDAIANDVPDLLRQIDGRTVTVAGKPLKLETAGLTAVAMPPDWRTELLEFFNPGAVAPGVVGVISLLVALYALAFIPINYAGVALVIVGIVLMIAE